MSLAPGKELLHYRLTDKLGEGGMGVVWRALDTTLDRSVAIKVLPESFADDADRVARFEREAKLLASLNHPNIASIYSVHRVEGRHLIALELVEGEELAAATARGPIPVEDSIRLAIGIAQALEAAHESGVIHRDLKPANVKLAADGTVKVLDFGLAKAIDAAPSADGMSPTFAPTVTSAGTRAGMILGTAAYMSPEQARGKPLDRRTDLWSFGCLLYECLTGVVLFGGETVSDSLAAILRKEIDFSLIPAETPPSVVRLLKRCLQRDPALRQQNAGDARIELLDAQVEPAPDASPTTVHARPARWLAAAMVLLVGLSAGWLVHSLWGASNSPDEGAVLRLGVPIPDTLRIQASPQYLPDGNSFVFLAIDAKSGADHDPYLYVKDLEDGSLVRLEGSAGTAAYSLSPSGESIAFTVAELDRNSRKRLYRAALDQRTPPQLLFAELPNIDSISWLSSETIAAINDDEETLLLYPASGVGETRQVELRGDVPPFGIELRKSLPGGQHILIRGVTFETGAYSHYIAVLSVETGKFDRLLMDASKPALLNTGQLVFGRGGQLMIAPFDLESLSITGSARVVMDGLWSYGSYAGGFFDVSKYGDLLYVAGEVQGRGRQIRLLNRDGTHTSWSEDRVDFNSVLASPDGEWVASQVDNTAEGDALLQIRLSRTDRPRFLTLEAPPATDCSGAVWSTNSERVAYQCHNSETVSVLIVDAESPSNPRTLAELDVLASLNLIGFVRGDRYILAERAGADGDRELVSVDTTAPDPAAAVERLETQEPGWRRFSISRDGRALIYTADASGRRELSVRRIDANLALGPRLPVDLPGVSWAFWSSSFGENEHEVVFGRDGVISTARLSIGRVAELGEPQVVVPDGFDLNLFYVERLNDEQMLFIQMSDGERGSSDIRLTQNWRSEITRLASTPLN